MKFSLIKNRDPFDVVALLLGLLALVFWVFILGYKYWHFGYYDWDLAFFSQAMWSLSHGSPNVSLFDSNFFSNHANLIAYGVLPIYIFFPHPLTLVYLKVISYIAAGLVLYAFTKERLNPAAALIFLFLYLIYVPNILGLVFEFDFESVSPVFLMLAFYCYMKDHWLAFLICAVILILIKENMPLIILAFSIHAFFVKKDKWRWAVLPALLALISFYLLIYVFIPYVSGQPIGRESSHAYIAHNYRAIGGSIPAVLLNIVLHPIQIINYAWVPSNVKFLKDVFIPFVGLPFARLDLLFLISPILIQHLLSASATEHAVKFAYVMTMAPFLFLASMEALRFFYMRKKTFYLLLLAIFCLSSILNFFQSFPLIKGRYMKREDWVEDPQTLQHRWDILRMIPNDAPVVSSLSFLAPLSQRRDLYSFLKIYDSAYQNDDNHFVLPDRVKYALINFNERWLLYDIRHDPHLIKGRLKDFFKNNWAVKAQDGAVILFEHIGH